MTARANPIERHPFFAACSRARTEGTACVVVSGDAEDLVAAHMAREIGQFGGPRAYVVVAPSGNASRRIANRLQNEIVCLADSEARVAIEQLPSMQRTCTVPFTFTIDGTAIEVWFVANEQTVAALPTEFCGPVSLLLVDGDRIALATRAHAEVAVDARRDRWLYVAVDEQHTPMEIEPTHA